MNNPKDKNQTINIINSNIQTERNINRKENNQYKKISNTMQGSPNINNNLNVINNNQNNKVNNDNMQNNITPFNDINEYDQQLLLKNPKKKKDSINNNDKEHSMMNLYNNNFGSVENSFDTSNLFKKRRIEKRKLSQSPRIYAPKKALNQRGNSLGKINNNSITNKSNININNVNYINNINTIIKNKNNDSMISIAYTKKSPVADSRRRNDINMNNNRHNYVDNEYNYNYNNFDNDNINNIMNDMQRYNKNINSSKTNINNIRHINNYNSVNNYNNEINVPRKKYLIGYKTTSMLKKRKKLYNYNDVDLSSDQINYNQNSNLRRRNDFFNNNYNYDNNDNNNNIYNNRVNKINNLSTNQQRMNRKNQNVPSIYQGNPNNSLSQRYNYNNYNSNDYSYYNNSNNIINNYKDYDSFNNNNINNNNYNDYENASFNDNDNGNYYLYNNNMSKKQNVSMSINIEDLLVLEEKLSEIIIFLKNRREVKNQSFDFWNYYYNCSIYQRIEKTFKTDKNIEIIRISINLELLSIMLCYEFSFDPMALSKAYILLSEILQLNHQNLMLICENILIKICPENQKNKWVLKLNKIVQNYKRNEMRNNNNNMEVLSLIDKINNNSDKINRKLLNILLNYKTEYSPLILSLMKKIIQKNYEEINDFFREYILKVENMESSIVASVLLSTNPNFNSWRPPYIHSPRVKAYTLILDLNETLVNFQQTNFSQGVVRLRPFLIEFLEEISYYYELILFTASTEYFAKPIISAIEENKKYFDFVFYRECAIIIGNDFVKDLTRIGRPLDSTIIVDNMPQNFRLQKENGINIKPFYAQDPNDSALYDLLPILIDIAEEEGDVREGLAKYRNEIVMKVTSKISKYNI